MISESVNWVNALLVGGAVAGTLRERSVLHSFTCSRHAAAISSVDFGIHLSPGVITHCSKEPCREARQTAVDIYIKHQRRRRQRDQTAAAVDGHIQTLVLSDVRIAAGSRRALKRVDGRTPGVADVLSFILHSIHHCSLLFSLRSVCWLPSFKACGAVLNAQKLYKSANYMVGFSKKKSSLQIETTTISTTSGGFICKRTKNGQLDSLALYYNTTPCTLERNSLKHGGGKRRTQPTNQTNQSHRLSTKKMKK